MNGDAWALETADSVGHLSRSRQTTHGSQSAMHLNEYMNMIGAPYFYTYIRSLSCSILCFNYVELK